MRKQHDRDIDLNSTSVAQKLRLLATPLILILAFAFLALRGSWWWLGIVVVVPFLAANTSIAMHDVGHGLVFGRLRHCLLFVLGVAHMLSGHAFWVTHSQHHKRFPSCEQDDPEGTPAQKPFLGVIQSSPLFVPRLWIWAWRSRPSARRWLLVELLGASAILLLGALLWWLCASPGLLVYALSTLVSSWIGYAVIAWLSHQPRILSWPRRQALAGTLIGTVLVYFFGVIIFHEEHHQHENTPSVKLAEIARGKSR